MSDMLVPGRKRYPKLMVWPFYFDWPVSSAAFKHCCKALSDAVVFKCNMHKSPFECGDSDFIFNEVFREYGVIHHNPEGTYVRLIYCPFCSKRLPGSLREKWMETLERAGFDPFGGGLGDLEDVHFSYTEGWRRMGIPEKYLSAAWYSQSGKVAS